MSGTHNVKQAWLSEIFSSAQGEGPCVGVRQIFVRFSGCHRRCAFCDTPAALDRPRSFRCDPAPGRQANPVTPGALLRLLAKLDRPPRTHHSIALTGGEPLLQSEFLISALPLMKARGWRTYLETAGDRPRELARVLRWIDLVAMDIKLPSVTGQPGRWTAHRKFLELCTAARVDPFVKIVVSRATAAAELRRAARLVAAVAPQTPVILQPATPHRGVRAPTPRQLGLWQISVLTAGLRDVRVIPQCHVLLKIR